MRNLAQEQAAMRARHTKRKAKARAPRAPKLQRGITVAPVRRRKPVVDMPELAALLCAHLRSPKIKASDFAELLDLGTRYGLVLPNIRPTSSEETEAGPDVRVGESQVSLKEVLRLEREQRARITKEREKPKK